MKEQTGDRQRQLQSAKWRQRFGSSKPTTSPCCCLSWRILLMDRLSVLPMKPGRLERRTKEPRGRSRRCTSKNLVSRWVKIGQNLDTLHKNPWNFRNSLSSFRKKGCSKLGPFDCNNAEDDHQDSKYTDSNGKVQNVFVVAFLGSNLFFPKYHQIIIEWTCSWEDWQLDRARQSHSPLFLHWSHTSTTRGQ